jgi:hypothetical protein
LQSGLAAACAIVVCGVARCAAGGATHPVPTHNTDDVGVAAQHDAVPRVAGGACRHVEDDMDVGSHTFVDGALNEK